MCNAEIVGQYYTPVCGDAKHGVYRRIGCGVSERG